MLAVKANMYVEVTVLMSEKRYLPPRVGSLLEGSAIQATKLPLKTIPLVFQRVLLGNSFILKSISLATLVVIGRPPRPLTMDGAPSHGADNSNGRPLLLSEVIFPNRMRFLFVAFEIRLRCRFGQINFRHSGYFPQ
jgi:hypothetical protein